MDPSERKPVRVTILNQTYTLAASGEPGEVEALAHSVDDLMNSIARRSRNTDSQGVAVLACLHIADQLRSTEKELARLRERVGEKARDLGVLLDKIVE